MTDRLDQLRARLQAARDALETEFDARREAIRYRVEGARVVFEEDVRATHRAARENLADFLRRTRPLVVLTAPIIYSLILPLVLLDLFRDALPGGLLSGLRDRTGPPPRSCRDRPSPPRLSQRPATAELRLLRLRQRRPVLRPRDRGPDRGLLVPDQARPPRRRPPMTSWQGFCGLRRCRGVFRRDRPATCPAAPHRGGSARLGLWLAPPRELHPRIAQLLGRPGPCIGQQAGVALAGG